MRNITKKILNENFDWVGDVPEITPWEIGNRYVLDVTNLDIQTKRRILRHMDYMGYVSEFVSVEAACYYYFEDGGDYEVSWNSCGGEEDMTYGGKYELISYDMWIGMMEHSNLNENDFGWVDDVDPRLDYDDPEWKPRTGEEYTFKYKSMIGVQKIKITDVYNGSSGEDMVVWSIDGNTTYNNTDRMPLTGFRERMEKGDIVSLDTITEDTNFDWVGDVALGWGVGTKFYVASHLEGGHTMMYTITKIEEFIDSDGIPDTEDDKIYYRAEGDIKSSYRYREFVDMVFDNGLWVIVDDLNESENFDWVNNVVAYNHDHENPYKPGNKYFIGKGSPDWYTTDDKYIILEIYDNNDDVVFYKIRETNIEANINTIGVLDRTDLTNSDKLVGRGYWQPYDYQEDKLGNLSENFDWVNDVLDESFYVGQQFKSASGPVYEIIQVEGENITLQLYYLYDDTYGKELLSTVETIQMRVDSGFWRVIGDDLNESENFDWVNDIPFVHVEAGMKLRTPNGNILNINKVEKSKGDHYRSMVHWSLSVEGELLTMSDDYDSVMERIDKGIWEHIGNINENFDWVGEVPENMYTVGSKFYNTVNPRSIYKIIEITENKVYYQENGMSSSKIISRKITFMDTVFDTGAWVVSEY